NAEFIDATEVIATTAGPLDAAPDVERTRELARRAILRRVARGVMPVVPGFIGSSTNGSTTTLGRGGSDLTATLLAAALGSREVQLWKDVPGLLSADPRVVPDARLLKRISVDEAAALSRHGSRLIHPKALAVLDRATRVRVRSFGNPLHDGTVIAAGRPNTGQPVKAITSLQGLSMITVGHTGLQESVWAVAYRAVSSSGNGLWFVPLSAGAADASACMLVRGADAACVVSRVRRAVNAQSRKEAPNAPAVEVRSGLAAIGIVGPGVGGSGTASAMALRALEDAAVEVYASGAGHGQNSMTLVVDGAKAAVAQRALHGAFQLHLSGGGRLAQANYRAVLLVGTGTIGRALLAQLASVGDRLRICGVVDTSGYLCSAEGLTRKQAAAVLSAKSSGGCLRNLPDARAGGAADALRELSNHALSRKVLIDATAAETGHLLREAAAGGWDLVLANKLPLAGGQQAADELRAVVRGNRRAFRFEATVGAGLPVIQTVRKLQHSGDTVRRIEGCPSGTLGFVFGELERGSSFSAAVRLASERGLTEPDPRVDLSGLDVARKALILGRLLGFRGELQDVAVESLVPERLLTASITDFLHSLRQEDAAWAARVRRARARGRVLRYRIRVTHRKVAAGLAEVDASDSLGRLSGTDNQFTFTSARYGSNPLVITGPGAGAEVTAAGVLGDLLELDSMETWP
ncbi:MAG TPA: hypothetical protein VKZ41_12565, partial [Gemmatimonadales bacterium]|nr:hypothetical protein [Gemmatimonadales bacterium]